MKFLLLNGHGISLNVQNAKLHVKNGFYDLEEKPEEFIYSPKRIDVDSIIIYGQDGNITIDAVRWLIKHNVQVSFLDWNGKLLTTLLPPESVQVQTKFNQYTVHSNFSERIQLAKKFIEAKFEKTSEVLEWLKLKYPQVETDFEKEKRQSLESATTLNQILMIEANVSAFYWKQLRKVIPEKLEFEARGDKNTRPKGAGDIVNCLLNYGYSILEAECLKTINTTGLDTHVGFLHEKNAGKNSLAYDLQEPFRFLIDLVIIKSIENETFTKKDFIRTENYNLKLRSQGAKKLLTEIEKQLMERVIYAGKETTWRYIILLKTRELNQYLNGSTKKINFSNPKARLVRTDSQELRQKILAIPYAKAKNYGFSKGTLFYMKQNAKSAKEFKLYESTITKLRE